MVRKDTGDEATWSSESSYLKGDSTRQSILLAGLKAFSDADYKAVSTRAIAEIAGVKQPAINYYFGGKESLYLACVDTVVNKYYVHTGAAALQAEALLDSDAHPKKIREALLKLMHALSALMFSSDELWYCSAFIDRELKTPGPGHDRIYEKLWKPGIDLVGRLISAIKQSKTVEEESKVEAIFLLSSLLGFGSGRAVSRRLMNWDEIGASEASVIDKVIERQIALIVAGEPMQGGAGPIQ